MFEVRFLPSNKEIFNFTLFQAFPSANPSFWYYTPEYQAAYNPYSPYLSGTYLSTEGQYVSQHLGQQGYYSGPNFPLVPAYSWDNPSYMYGDYSPSRVSVDSLETNATIHTPKSANKVSLLYLRVVAY